MAALARAPLANPMRPGLEDGDLVALTLRGNPDAFATLVERYDRSVYHLAYRTLHDVEEARDATQEAFFKAFRQLADLPSRARSFQHLDLCHRLPRLLRPVEPPQTL